MIGQNKVKENPIGTEKIGRLIFRYAFPSVISMIVNFLQAIGKPIQASVATLFRQAVIIILAALILPLFFGIDGVLYAGPFAVSVSAVIIFFIIFPQIKNIKFSGEAEI